MKSDSPNIILGVLVLLAALGGFVVMVLPGISDGSEIRVVEAVPTVTPAPTSTPSLRDARVGVYVTGAVVNPGVYIVNGDSRLANVLLLAGGVTDDADITAVNLAVIVRDEEHWHIPRRGEAAPPNMGLVDSGRGDVRVGDGQSDHQPDGRVDGRADARLNGKVNLNSADVELLKTLPGIGDVKAQAIVGYREANGDFVSVDGLLDVNGIGTGTLDNIRNLVTVE